MFNNSTENCSQCLSNIELYTAPQAYELNVTTTVLLSAFLVLSAVGNMCTCVVVIRNKSMRSPTNYYLLNLAISDLIFSSFIPVEICIYCLPEFSLSVKLLIAHFFFYEFLGNFSVLTILAFTVERYLAITKPFSGHKTMLTSRICKVITTIWITSLTFSSFNTYWIYKVHKTDYAAWFTTFHNDYHKYFIGVLLIVFFVFPMCVIVVLFVLIVLHLKSSKQVLRANSLQTTRNRKRATKMLAAVAAFFFICWSPYFTLRVMALMDYSYPDHMWVWRVIIYMCSINSYMSAVVNPILYSLMSRKFRQAFKSLLGVRASSAKSNKSHSSRENTHV
ncbi:pyrokinin-1 receptor-like [Aricia agestis]|uniref:pyrokinin-1 receptor-like n=1 Tax=Aricia agestis TaxID=91739 RepID=UPI001C20577D|nr:pyrokinin-1 receptor-like [Aricia agestis]